MVFFLSLYELGVVQEEEFYDNLRLLAHLQNGTLMLKKFETPTDKSINVGWIGLQPTNNETKLEMFENLCGKDFMQLQNEFCTIDLNFLVAIIATDEQRKQQKIA